jgi:hypothetical protein
MAFIIKTSINTPEEPPLYITENTIILLHADEEPWVNSGTGSHVIYESGNVTLSPEGVFKFGSRAAAFTGVDGFAFTNHEDFFLAANDFTIDMWVYFTGFTSNGNTFAGSWNSGGAYIFTYDSANSKLRFVYNYPGTQTILSDNWTAETGQWYHVAAVRYNDNLTFYVNGVDYGGGAIGTIMTPNDMLTFGCLLEASKYGIKGYMDEIDFHVGEARWTSEFTPPTSPYTTT